MKGRLSFVVLASLAGMTVLPVSAEATCAYSYGKPDQVIADCTTLLSQTDLDKAKKITALRVRAGAYKEKKDIDHAVGDLNEGIRLDPTDAAVYWERASLYRFERKDIERSLSDINESIRLAPDSYPYVSFRGDLEVEKDDLAAATVDYGEVIRLNPKNVGGYYSRGQVWLMRGDYKHALDDFDAGFVLSPDYGNIIKGRNRTHAALAAGAALLKAEGASPEPARSFQASPTKNLYSEARSWKDGSAVHHCTIEFDGEKASTVFGRGRSGYVLVVAAGQWSLSAGASYPVRVSIGDAPKKQATATVMDAITIAVPLGQDIDLVERTKGYQVPISLQAGQNTIPVPSPNILDYAQNLETCWSKATAPAAAANPFGPPAAGASAPSATNPFAGTEPAAVASPAPTAPPTPAGGQMFDVVAGWEIGRGYVASKPQVCLKARAYKDQNDNNAENLVSVGLDGNRVIIVLKYERWSWGKQGKLTAPLVIGGTVFDAKTNWISDGTSLTANVPDTVVSRLRAAQTIELSFKNGTAAFEIPGFDAAYDSLRRCSSGETRPASAAKSVSNQQKRGGAYFGAIYLQELLKNCDVPTTGKQRRAFDTKLAELQKEMASSEAGARKAASDEQIQCPPAGEMSETLALMQKFSDSTPEDFYDSLPRSQDEKTGSSEAPAKP